jgi:glycosyltransferase involved in cell wall biosynthesis
MIHSAGHQDGQARAAPQSELGGGTAMVFGEPAGKGSGRGPEADVAVKSGLRIAIIGSRGIPAGYGGFETFAQELAPRLVERGHEVTVYCRKGYTAGETLDEYKGVKLVHTPALRSRSLEQLSHELTSIIDSGPRNFDLYYCLGYRGSPLYVSLRAAGKIVIDNTDGFEWKRRKWNRLGRTYLRMAEWIVARLGADELISDAEAIRQYFLRTYGRESTHVVYGAYTFGADARRPEVLERYEVTPGGYYLVVCRIEPENNVDLIVREFIASGSDRELVVVGGMNYETPFWQELQRLAAGSRVRFVGPVYGSMLIESLLLGARGYFHGHEVGGTNPALLNAMGCGSLVIALDTEFNRENLVDAGRYFSKEEGSLADQIRWADGHPREAAALGQAARERIRARYTWDSAADKHDALFREVARKRGFHV